MREENVAALRQGGTPEEMIAARRALHTELLQIAWNADCNNDTGSNRRRSRLAHYARRARALASAVETLQGLDVDRYATFSADLRRQVDAEIGGY